MEKTFGQVSEPTNNDVPPTTQNPQDETSVAVANLASIMECNKSPETNQKPALETVTFFHLTLQSSKLKQILTNIFYHSYRRITDHRIKIALLMQMEAPTMSWKKALVRYWTVLSERLKSKWLIQRTHSIFKINRFLVSFLPFKMTFIFLWEFKINFTVLKIFQITWIQYQKIKLLRNADCDRHEITVNSVTTIL